MQDSWCLVLALLVTSPGFSAQEPPPEPLPLASQTDEDRARGKRLFQAQCSRCHGMEGEGGEGPSLSRPSLRRAADDEALFGLVRGGIPGAGMPATWQRSDGEIWQLVGYVRSLGRAEAEPLPGDPERGRLAYEELGCEACHVLDGVGEGLGPELTAIGTRRGLRHLRESLLRPEESVDEEYLVVGVRTADGVEVRGVRLNEDAFTLQLKDLNHRLHSFEKGELAQMRKEIGKSLMPSYRTRASTEEIDALVAYLASQREEE